MVSSKVSPGDIHIRLRGNSRPAGHVTGRRAVSGWPGVEVVRTANCPLGKRLVQ